jgi:hypothetical protein
MSEKIIDLQVVYAKLLDEVVLARSLVREKYLASEDSVDFLRQDDTLRIIEYEICQIVKSLKVTF